MPDMTPQEIDALLERLDTFRHSKDALLAAHVIRSLRQQAEQAQEIMNEMSRLLKYVTEYSTARRLLSDGFFEDARLVMTESAARDAKQQEQNRAE